MAEPKIDNFSGPVYLKLPINPNFSSFKVCVRIIPDLEHKAEP